MTRRLALAALAVASLLVLSLCLIGGGPAEVAFAVLAMAFPSALMLLGTARSSGRASAAAGPIVALLVLLEASLAGMLLFRGEVSTGPWLLGLPIATAIQLYGIFLLPLALVVVGYALTFDSVEVSEDDLERLRRASDTD